MTIIVEDGSGLPNANSYVTVSEADTFNLAENNTSWASVSRNEKEAALIKATRYLDTKYSYLYERRSYIQALEFPRTFFIWEVDYEIRQLKQACMILAFKSLTSDLYSDFLPQQVIEEKVGPITRKRTASKYLGQTMIVEVDNLLKSLIRNARGEAKVYRA